MTFKQLEIRDRGTCIPSLAIRVSGEDGPIMRRAGFQSPMIYLVMLATQQCRYDPYGWSAGRTMPHAHHYVEEHWDEIPDHSVVDVEWILGERTEPKTSEIQGVY